ncbi:hypothetical protein BUALT_Bualt14G0002300 [Buddleja alternifolia]|uniref:Uncharacterized protein n=1 Tax=Buddleja alternifolia TaxID=168488 RepID=A0AAV6WFP4_9LAMI|nr:hypothetical protein BUALT_Bualt14G0002300 [Buddleja alternifolia]
MEGLIPMVYKSLKKSKTRRRYECLSTGAAQTYNIADFYIKEDDHQYFTKTPEPDKVSGLRGSHHRRCNSVQVDRAGGFALEDDAAKPKQLVRFRSHRMFACVTGA